MERKHNYLVDIIKFVAAIMVIFSHSFHLASNSKDTIQNLTNNLLTIGGISVAIFFSYSGYYIYKSIKKNDKNFIKNRVKRIFPELFVVVLISIFIVGPLFTTKTTFEYFFNYKTYLYFLNVLLIPYHNLPGVFLNNCFTSTVNGSLWTLPVEFFCYILLFVLYKLYKNKEKDNYLIIISNIFLIVVLMTLKIFFSNLSIFGLAVSAIKAMLVFLNAAYLSKYEKINKYIYIISIILLPTVFIWKNWYYINFIYCFVIPLAIIGSLRFNLKGNKIISYLGESSYAIYLFGFVVQQSVIAMFGGQMLWYVNFIISSIISIILGCSLNCFMIKLKNKYSFF